MGSETLLVIGAGPKALALHVRAKALSDLGRESPRIAVIEKSGIGANWRGEVGYTDGTPPLVTPPEWDVGFPYYSGVRELDLLTARYSWHTYLIAKGFPQINMNDRAYGSMLYSPCWTQQTRCCSAYSKRSMNLRHAGSWAEKL